MGVIDTWTTRAVTGGAVVALTLLAGCASEEESTLEPGVEPSIIFVAPTGPMAGQAVLTLLLDPAAEGAAEVWLYDLTATQTYGNALIGTNTEFPVSLEPGDFARIHFTYALPDHTCTHKLTGNIFDTLTGQLTPVTAASVDVPGC